jgi:hypothetical protein
MTDGNWYPGDKRMPRLFLSRSVRERGTRNWSMLARAWLYGVPKELPRGFGGGYVDVATELVKVFSPEKLCCRKDSVTTRRTSLQMEAVASWRYMLCSVVPSVRTLACAGCLRGTVQCSVLPVLGFQKSGWLPIFLYIHSVGYLNTARNWIMASSGMLRRVALVRTDVSEERGPSFIRVARIGELGTMLAVTSNRFLPSPLN